MNQYAPGILKRFPIAAFLIALVFFIVSFPFAEYFSEGDMIESVLLTVMLLFALPVLGARRKSLAWGIILVAPALTGKWLSHWLPHQISAIVFLVPALIFVSFVLLTLLRFLLRSPRVNSEVLCAGVAGHLLIGLLWAFAYLFLSRLIPGAFDFTASAASANSMMGFTAIYFSFITLCTVGYGEIVPVSGPARMLVIMEAMAGTFYMAILVARLVALYSTAKPATSQTPDIAP